MADLASTSSPDAAEYGAALPLRKVEGSRGCAAVAVAGDCLFAAGSRSLDVFDISGDPSTPRRIATMKGIRGCRQMAISGDRAYITARSHGLWIVDIGDPRNPKLIRRFDTIELATGIAAWENVVFVAHRVYGVQLLDVTDPRFPKHISQVRTAEAQSVVCNGGMLYVGDWGVGRLTIIDIHDLRAPRVVSQGALDGFGDGVFVKGDLCFCSTGHDAKTGSREERQGRGRGVEVFDISDTASPRKLGVFKFPRFLPRDNDFWTVRVCGDTAFCVDSHNGFYMLDVSDPANMKGIGHVQLPPPVYWAKTPKERRLAHDCCASLATGDAVVYVAGRTTGIYVIETPLACKQPTQKQHFDIPPERDEAADPRLQRCDLGCQVRRVAVKDDLAYVAASHGGLKLFGIGKSGLEELKTWKRACVYDVAVHGDILYAAENSVDLVAYRIAPGGDLQEIGRGRLGRNGDIHLIHLFKDGRYAAVSGGTGTLHVLDLSDPAKPKEVFDHSVGGILYGDMLPMRDLDGVFPVNWHSRGIAWYRIAEGTVDVIGVDRTIKGSQLDGIAQLDNGRFIFPVRGSRIALLDPDAPGAPKLLDVKSIPPGMPIRGIPTVNGNTVAFASRRDGKVVTLDLSTPENPTVVRDRCYDLSQGNCDRIVFHRGKMLIPAGHYGLFLEK